MPLPLLAAVNGEEAIDLLGRLRELGCVDDYLKHGIAKGDRGPDAICTVDSVASCLKRRGKRPAYCPPEADCPCMYLLNCTIVASHQLWGVSVRERFSAAVEAAFAEVAEIEFETRGLLVDGVRVQVRLAAVLWKAVERLAADAHLSVDALATTIASQASGDLAAELEIRALRHHQAAVELTSLRPQFLA